MSADSERPAIMSTRLKDSQDGSRSQFRYYCLLIRKATVQTTCSYVARRPSVTNVEIRLRSAIRTRLRRFFSSWTETPGSPRSARARPREKRRANLRACTAQRRCRRVDVSPSDLRIDGSTAVAALVISSLVSLLAAPVCLAEGRSGGRSSALGRCPTRPAAHERSNGPAIRQKHRQAAVIPGYLSGDCGRHTPCAYGISPDDDCRRI